MTSFVHLDSMDGNQQERGAEDAGRVALACFPVVPLGFPVRLQYFPDRPTIFPVRLHREFFKNTTQYQLVAGAQIVQ